jgi:hypothetical protein
MVKKTSFEYLDEEARHDAGLFINEACDWLGISRGTWLRWEKSGLCPIWAYRTLKLKSDDLSLGWKYFYLDKGVLYRSDLNPKYYNWDESDLMATVWCRYPAHINQRLAKAGIRTSDGHRVDISSNSVNDIRRQEQN